MLYHSFPQHGSQPCRLMMAFNSGKSIHIYFKNHACLAVLLISLLGFKKSLQSNSITNIVSFGRPTNMTGFIPHKNAQMKGGIIHLFITIQCYHVRLNELKIKKSSRTDRNLYKLCSLGDKTITFSPNQDVFWSWIVSNYFGCNYAGPSVFQYYERTFSFFIKL